MPPSFVLTLDLTAGPPEPAPEVAAALVARIGLPRAPSRILINTGPSERGSHRLETMLRCPQLYAYQNVMKHPTVAGARWPLVRGTMLHVGLGHHYARMRAAQRGENPEAYYEPHDAIEAAVANMSLAEQNLADDLRKIVHPAIDKYRANYDDRAYEIMEVEHPVEAIIGGHRVTQRWDLVTRDRAGRVWITDHKGTSKIESKSFRRYALAIQFLIMHWIGSLTYGEKFGGIRINMIGFEGAPDSYRFKRAAPEPAPHALTRLPQTIVDAEGLIQFYADRDPWTYTRVFSEQVCMGPYGPCDGMELCRWGPRAGP